MPTNPVKLPHIEAKNHYIITKKESIVPESVPTMVQEGARLRKDSVTGSHASIASTAASIASSERRPSISSNYGGSTGRRPSVSGNGNIAFGGGSDRRTSITSSVFGGSRRGSLVGGMPPKRSFLNISKAIGKTAVLRKMFGGSKHDDLSSIEEVAMPKSPRFSATLSPEAQFAMLKGYEDLLITTLGEKYPEHVEELKRCTTPTKHIELNEEEQRKKTIGNLFRANRISSSKSDTAVFVDSGRLPSLPSKKKQLVLTHRFNCAMDIIDVVKTNQGNLTISPRIKEKQFSDPVSQYSTWSRVWTREFKL